MKKQLSNVKITVISLLVLFNFSFIFSQNFDFTITDANMTVQVGADVCNSVMEPGDLLGAFFSNSQGELENAGYQEFLGEQLAIAVWASEAGVGNGFAAGENIQWAMYDSSEGNTILLDSEMNTLPPFSSTFVSNGFGQVISLDVASTGGCADNNDLVSPLDCATASSALGCDFVYNGALISDACPETCDSCEDCSDNNDLVSPLDCATASSALGCDFNYNGVLISDACPETCDSCGGTSPVLGCTDEDAINYDLTATEDDGSCIITGCTCDLATNYLSTATIDDGSCVILSGGCGDSDADNYSGDSCSGSLFVASDCEYASVDVVIGPFDYTITDANMTVQVSSSTATWNGGSPPPNGSLLGAFFTNDNEELQCAGYATMDGSDQYAIAVWASESGLDNGFAAGEEFTWVLSLNGESFIADSFEMNSSPPFSPTFVSNGFGQILSVAFSGESTVVAGCTDSTACNYDTSATEDDGSCTFADSGYDCEGVCLADADGDGICDEFEEGGCTDSTACNYDNTVTEDNGSCIFADSGYDCEGVCLLDTDGDGVCDEFETSGCTDSTACNYDNTATDDDDSCTFADSGYDCEGVCLSDADGDGVCDEFEVSGCTNPLAINYNSAATNDDGGCEFQGNLVQLDFIWDAYVNENEFEVNSVPEFSEVLSGNATETSFQVNLNPGIYIVNITDQFGDGVINGNLTVTEIINGIETDVELYPSSSFAGTWSETSIYFAVGGAEIIPGCMDSSADNFNASANIDYLQVCEFPAEPGPNWEVFSTDPSSSHIIGLMPGSNFLVDGIDLTAGSFIGVFYTDDNGELACGGFTEWEGPGSVGVISAQMDDSTTDEKDGFSEGEPLYFKIWSQDFTCEYSDAINPIFEEQDFFFTSDDGLFSSNGISGLISFDIVNLVITETHSDYSGFGVSCNGATDGSIDVTVSGGSGVYTYEWSNGSNTEDLSDIGAGTYSLIATDENGCSVSIVVEINESDAMAISETHSDYTGFGVSCNGATDGSIDVTVSGGTGVYTYEWSNGDTTEDLFDIGAGTYLLIATDQNGCSVSIEVEITETDPIVISETHSDYNGFGVSCNDATDGSIDVTVMGGTGNYTYSWTQAGDMAVIWPDSNDPLDLNNGLGTGGNATMMINFTPDGIETGDVIGVFYEGDGETGPTGAYTCAGFVVWDDSMPPAAITVLGNVDNAFGMEEGSPLTMFMYDSSEQSTYSINNEWNTGAGWNDPASGYTNNGLFQILDMSFLPFGTIVGTSEDLFDIGAGTYSVVATDENGCSVSIEVEITESDEMTISSIASDYTGFGVSCNGATDGSIDVTVSGGTGNYTYTWSQDGSMAVIWPDSNDPLDLNNGLGTGGNATMMINFTPDGIETGDVIGVFYEGDGETGPTGAYTCAGFVVWDDSMPPAAITVLGNVDNAFGMEEGSPLTMFMYDSSEQSTYSINNEWNTGAGWNDPASGYTNNGLFQILDMSFESFSSGIGANTEDINNIGAGTFTIIVTDENGCTVSETVLITEADEMAISEIHSDYTGFGVSCNGATDGSIDLTVTGGTGNYTYAWSNGSTSEDLFDIGAGTYSVIATDENGCSVSIVVEITESDAMAISETHSDYTGFGVSCNGATDGSIDVTVSGGTGFYTYEWSNGSTSEDLSDIGAGTYSVIATDQNGCSVSIVVEINESDSMAISETHSDYTGFGVSCNGATDGSIDVTVSGGTGVYTYAWSNGSTSEDLSALGAGTYTVTATDENGCSVSIDVVITEADEMAISEIHSDYTGFGVSCNGATDGSIDLTVTGGTGVYTYAWSNGSTSEDLFDIGAGTYSVIATDENGCSVSIVVEITESDAMAISETHSDYTGFGVSCNGATDGSIDVTVSGGTGFYTYEWSNGSTSEDLSNIGAGTYSVIATDQNGCSVSIVVEINESDAMTLIVDQVLAGPHVLGDIEDGFGSISITVEGGTGQYTYEWTASLADGTTTWENGDDIDGLFAGTYSVVATDENGCTVSSDITVPFYSPSNPEWTVEETSCSHSIEVPVDADISIDSEAITYGDWIAASLNGQVVGIMMWNLEESTMTVYSESDLEGAEFEWFIWNANEANTDGQGSDSDNAYYSAEATYDQTYPNEADFACGGLSRVLDIVARTIYIQQIEIQEGWGLYSTFISPEDSSLEAVLSGINLTIVKDEEGNVFWPSLGINSIGSLTDGEGYSIKGNEVSMLEISGDLVSSDLQMYMPSGWSFIGYLHQESADASEMMSSLVDADNFVIMKDGSGNVYWPLIGVNTIGSGSGMMIPGQGYAVKVGQEDQFIYPDITNLARIGTPSVSYPLHNYKKAVNTGDNMVIGIPLNAWENVPNIGDEIAAYNSKGNLVGSVTFNGESIALTVWGDDSTTDEKDGLEIGESIALEIWTKSDDLTGALIIDNWSEGSDVYTSNGVSVVGNIRVDQSEDSTFELYPNYPNPFGLETTFSFFVPKASNVKIAIYDIVGNMVSELTNTNFETGMYELHYKASSISQGTYFVRMEAGETTLTKKIDILK